MPDETAPVSSDAASRIDLYWRPGCGFCALLQRRLDHLGIERTEHNIWDDPDDAATVRRFANGNETVPTIVIGDQGFVNPSVGELVNYLLQNHRHLLPEVLSGP